VRCSGSSRTTQISPQSSSPPSACCRRAHRSHWKCSGEFSTLTCRYFSWRQASVRVFPP
jgi:hypothetical protein